VSDSAFLGPFFDLNVLGQLLEKAGNSGAWERGIVNLLDVILRSCREAADRLADFGILDWVGPRLELGDNCVLLLSFVTTFFELLPDRMGSVFEFCEVAAGLFEGGNYRIKRAVLSLLLVVIGQSEASDLGNILGGVGHILLCPSLVGRRECRRYLGALARLLRDGDGGREWAGLAAESEELRGFLEEVAECEDSELSEAAGALLEMIAQWEGECE
jgi:hypothetical protein